MVERQFFSTLDVRLFQKEIRLYPHGQDLTCPGELALHQLHHSHFLK